MNCNLYKVLNYLKNNDYLNIDDETEKQLYFYFHLTIPNKFKWETTIKISDDLTVQKSGIITRDEYLSIKYKSPDTVVNFGSMGQNEFKTTLSNIEFNDNPELIELYLKQYISYDNNLLSYINE